MSGDANACPRVRHLSGCYTARRSHYTTPLILYLTKINWDTFLPVPPCNTVACMGTKTLSVSILTLRLPSGVRYGSHCYIYCCHCIDAVTLQSANCMWKYSSFVYYLMLFLFNILFCYTNTLHREVSVTYDNCSWKLQKT